MDRERYYGLSKRSQKRKMKEVPRTTAQSQPDFAVELQKHCPSQFGSPKHDHVPSTTLLVHTGPESLEQMQLVCRYF